MKTKSKNFIIPLVIYPFDLMVSLGQTDEQFKKSLGQFDLELEDHVHVIGYRLGRFMMFEDGQSFVRIRDYPVMNNHYATIQHEVFHAVLHILNRIGIKCNKHTEEAHAYLITYLTTEIYNRI